MGNSSTRDSPPGQDQFEVSIFGPGKGEAVAIHVGAGDWITVDSCWDHATASHPVLEYFGQCGVAVGQQVRLVVGTHAHDDHIAGIGRLFEEAREARFVSSVAINAREFFAALIADRDIEAELGVAVRSEYRAVMAEMKRRTGPKRGGRPAMWALEQRTLWERPATPEIPGARVVALSPSDEAVSRARDALAAGVAVAGNRRRLSSIDPNEASVALWIEVGGVTALLGADLLTGPSGCGWEAVLASHQATPPASLFKVPHHGSATAHHPDVWTELLSQNVVSVLAPYRAGRKPLPASEDVARLCALSRQAFVTADVRGPTPGRAIRKTSAALTTIASNVRDPFGKIGQIRARWDTSSASWNCELFHPARPLTGA